MVIAPSTNGSVLSALDEQTGNTLWTFQPSQGISIWGVAAPSPRESVWGGIVAGDTLYSDGYDSQNNAILYALNTTNGKERWHLSNPLTAASPTVQAATDDSVYLAPQASAAPILSALNASDGKERWHIQAADGDYYWSVTVLNGVVYASTSGDDRGGTGQGILYALNASDGKELWHTPPAQDSRSFSIPIVSQGVVYISDGAGVYAFDAASGQQLWHTKPGGGIEPVVQDGLVYTDWYDTSTTSDHLTLFLSALDARTGAERWRSIGVEGPLFSSTAPPPIPLVANGVAYITAATGVQALRASDGKPLWQNNTLTSLMVAAG